MHIDRETRVMPAQLDLAISLFIDVDLYFRCMHRCGHSWNVMDRERNSQMPPGHLKLCTGGDNTPTCIEVILRSYSGPKNPYWSQIVPVIGYMS